MSEVPIGCKHFHPSEEALKHDGVQPNDEYKFNRNIIHSVCLNPLNNPPENSVLVGCPYDRGMQNECGIYDPEPVMIVGHIVCDEEKVSYIVAGKDSIGIGFYAVVITLPEQQDSNSNSAVLTHVKRQGYFDLHTYEKLDALTRAIDYALENAPEGSTYEKCAPAKLSGPVNAYVHMVVSG